MPNRHAEVCYKCGNMCEPGQYKWKQANGEVIEMKDMSIWHLGNALRLCEENGNTGKADDLREVLEIKKAEEAADLLDD